AGPGCAGRPGALDSHRHRGPGRNRAPPADYVRAGVLGPSGGYRARPPGRRALGGASEHGLGLCGQCPGALWTFSTALLVGHYADSWALGALALVAGLGLCLAFREPL